MLANYDYDFLSLMLTFFTPGLKEILKQSSVNKEYNGLRMDL